MASTKQMEANRANARLSTGPKTITGKEISKFNALKHGMAANTPVLRHESTSVYEQTRASLYTEFQPVGISEEMLVDQIALAHWRMVRTGRAEAAMLDLEMRTFKRNHGLHQTEEHEDDAALALLFTQQDEKKFATWYRYQNHAERSFYKAIDSLHKAQYARLRKEGQLNRISNQKDSTIAKPSPLPPAAKPEPKLASFREHITYTFPSPSDPYKTPRHPLANTPKRDT